MTYLQAILLSLVEGITEFLPISSTGHLILASSLFRIPQTEFLKSFEIIIQFGAILAVIVVSFQEIYNKYIWKPIIIAFIPTAIIGFTLYHFIKTVLFESTLITAMALFIGGIILLFIDRILPHTTNSPSVEKTTFKQTFIIGLVQSLSAIPGVSRAAASIIGGQLVGLDRTTAVKFSFLLAIPTIFAAASLDLIKAGLYFSSSEYALLSVGFIGAFISGLITIKWFLKYISTHSFFWFGVYRIVIACLFLRVTSSSSSASERQTV